MVRDWIWSFLVLFAPWARWLLRYSLFVVLVQLLIGGITAYCLAERWQRWRQRRDFQHRTLVKFSELSYEMMDRLSGDERGRVMVHFRVDLDGRVFAACSPYLSAETYKGKRLVVHAVLVTCPACNAAARAMKEQGT